MRCFTTHWIRFKFYVQFDGSFESMEATAENLPSQTVVESISFPSLGNMQLIGKTIEFPVTSLNMQVAISCSFANAASYDPGVGYPGTTNAILLRNVYIKLLDPDTTEKHIVDSAGHWERPEYAHSFQGQLHDDEIGTINFKYRPYDPERIVFWTTDPLFRDYPWNSPYAFSENRVIDGIDLEGLEFYKYTKRDVYNPKTQKIEVVTSSELVDPNQPFKAEVTIITPYNHPIKETTRMYTDPEQLKNETGIVETMNTETFQPVLEEEERLTEEQKGWRFIRLPEIEVTPGETPAIWMRKIEDASPGATKGGENENQDKIDFNGEMPENPDIQDNLQDNEN